MFSRGNANSTNFDVEARQWFVAMSGVLQVREEVSHRFAMSVSRVCHSIIIVCQERVVGVSL